MLISRWSSDAFLRYIRTQVQEFARGFSLNMVSGPEFFTVPESDNIEYGVVNSPPPWLRVSYYETIDRYEHNQLGNGSNNNRDGARDADNDDLDEVNHAEETETPWFARRSGHRPEYGDDETHMNSKEGDSRSDEDYIEDSETCRRKTKRRKIT